MLGRMAPVAFNTTFDYIGTVRGRIGYAFGTVMPYVTGGFAWGHSHAVPPYRSTGAAGTRSRSATTDRKSVV